MVLDNVGNIQLRCSVLWIIKNQIDIYIYQHIVAEWQIHAFVNYTTIGSDNGLSRVWNQAIIWTNAGLLLIGPFGINFSAVWIKNHKAAF